MSVSTIFHVPYRAVQIGGEQHTGWIPAGDSIPLPTPIRMVSMRFEITDDGGGNYLLLSESEDGSLYGDTWHQTIEEAQEVAETSFGVRRDEWERATA